MPLEKQKNVELAEEAKNCEKGIFAAVVLSIFSSLLSLHFSGPSGIQTTAIGQNPVKIRNQVEICTFPGILHWKFRFCQHVVFDFRFSATLETHA